MTIIGWKPSGAIVLALTSLLIMQIATSGLFVHVPTSAGSNGYIPMLTIKGPASVSNGDPLTDAVYIDNNIPAIGSVGPNLVGAVKFTLVIQQICRDDPNSNDPSAGEMRGISVTIDNDWNAAKSFNVKYVNSNHEITVVAAASQNLDTSNGRKIADIQCTAQVNAPTQVIQNFKTVHIVKFDPTNPSHPIAVQVIGNVSDSLVGNATDAVGTIITHQITSLSDKFETDFYEKAKAMQEEELKRQQIEGESYKPKEHTVVIFVKQPWQLSENPDGFGTVEQIKGKLERTLIENHNASLVYKAEILSFISARLPVTEILKLGNYYYVDLIGDAERQAEPLNLRDKEFTLVRTQTDKILPIEPDLDVARQEINAAGLSYDGSGIRVAVVDTGIRQNHPDLPVGTKIVDQADCTSGTCQAGNYDDTSNHGTHIAGIIASTGNQNSVYKGIAAGALILNAKIGSTGGAIPAAIDWSILKGAKVISISTDFGNCVFDKNFLTTEKAIDEAVEKGVVVVAAIGNTGTNFITHPACSFNEITVGAIDDRNNPSKSDDIIWSSSSMGPAFDGGTVKRTKPDVVAPGVLIKSADKCTINGSDYNDRNYWNGATCLTTPVSEITGTSHAAPMVSAAAAILLQKNPTWTPAQVKAAIKQAAAASISNFPNIQPLDPNTRGAGVVDVAGGIAITSPDVTTWGSGLDISTYVVQSPVGTTGNPPTVQYQLVKETSGISTINGKFQQGSTTNQRAIFSKLAIPSIKIDGVASTLSDSKMIAGPRVDLTTRDQAPTFVTYNLNDVTVKVAYQTTKTSLSPTAVFSSTIQHTYEIVQYSDPDVRSPTSALDTSINDKARSARTGDPYTNEIKFTGSGTQFYIRDTKSSIPVVRYNSIVGFPSTWILVKHPMTDNPDQYLNNESINPADIVVDYKSSTSGAGSGLTLGPSMTLSLQQLTDKADVEVSADEKIDGTDTQLIADFLSGAKTPTQDQARRADVFLPASPGGICGDGSLDLNDLLAEIDIVQDRVSVETQCIG